MRCVRCFHVVYISCVGGRELRVVLVVIDVKVISRVLFVICGVRGGVLLVCLAACFVVCVRFVSWLAFAGERLSEYYVLLFAILAPIIVWCVMC